MSTPSLVVCTLLVASSFASPAAAADYNVVGYGARPDGGTDSAAAFLAAWAAACGDSRPARVVVPSGRFLVSQALFKGPCKNGGVTMVIQGTVVAPPAYNAATLWISFHYADGLTVAGGTLDAQGQAFWACKKAGRSCPHGATSLTIRQSKNVNIRGLTLLNSEVFHMSIFGSAGVTVQGAKIVAPADSPNTDGIHIQMSSNVNVVATAIATGDDCISMGAGTSNVWIQDIKCGPGHGISIGSLGGVPHESGVQNVTVRSVVFTGTQNGLRIKTWGRPNDGYVTGVAFSHITMQNVRNPIVVDQNYCPGRVTCAGQSSGIKISQVEYTDIEGTSATPVAVKFDCSASHPCSGIKLQDVKLTYQHKLAQAFCKNADGSTSGVVSPPISCL